jgi:hypothetical protein
MKQQEIKLYSYVIQQKMNIQLLKPCKASNVAFIVF